MNNNSDVLAIRSLHIAIASKYLEDNKYMIKDFYLCTVTDVGHNALHISKDEEFFVAIKKIKADYLFTEELKYIIISNNALTEGDYPVILTKEVAETYLVSKKDTKNKPLKVVEQDKIKELQHTLATIFGIY